MLSHLVLHLQQQHESFVFCVYHGLLIWCCKHCKASTTSNHLKIKGQEESKKVKFFVRGKESNILEVWDHLLGLYMPMQGDHWEEMMLVQRLVQTRNSYSYEKYYSYSFILLIQENIRCTYFPTSLFKVAFRERSLVYWSGLFLFLWNDSQKAEPKNAAYEIENASNELLQKCKFVYMCICMYVRYSLCAYLYFLMNLAQHRLMYSMLHITL